MPHAAAFSEVQASCASPHLGIDLPRASFFMLSILGLEYPQRCAHDTSRSNTCYENGLTEPVACPAGTLCVAPYAPAIPAAPGFLQAEVPYSVIDTEATTAMASTKAPLSSPTTLEEELTPNQTRATLVDTLTTLTTAAATNVSHAQTTQLLTTSPTSSGAGTTTTLLKRVLSPCPQGYYCNSGRSASEDVEELLCPASTYCLAPDVLEPIICDQGGNCTTEGCDVISSCPVRCERMISACPNTTMKLHNFPPRRRHSLSIVCWYACVSCGVNRLEALQKHCALLASIAQIRMATPTT